MRCPFCSAEDTKVTDSRVVNDGLQVRRRRECLKCIERFTTYETIELSLPRVIKRDGSYVQFDEKKLRTGILISLEKRTVSMDEIDNLVTSVIKKLRALNETEVDSFKIGQWVMEGLRNIDEVGYVRFASVYRKFKSVDEFNREIAKLKEKTEI